MILIKFLESLDLKKNEAMLTKEKIHYTIDSLPDNLTIDQVIDQMILLDKIEQGIKDVDDGRVYSSEEVKEKLSEWLK